MRMDKPIKWTKQCSMCLVCVDAEPDCRIDNEDPSFGDNVTLTCDVSYTDNISPMIMTWTDEQGRAVPSGSSTTRLVNSSVQIYCLKSKVRVIRDTDAYEGCSWGGGPPLPLPAATDDSYYASACIQRMTISWTTISSNQEKALVMMSLRLSHITRPIFCIAYLLKMCKFKTGVQSSLFTPSFWVVTCTRRPIYLMLIFKMNLDLILQNLVICIPSFLMFDFIPFTRKFYS